MGHWGHAHWGARMARVGGDGSIDLKEKNVRSAVSFTQDEKVVVVDRMPPRAFPNVLQGVGWC